MSLRSVPEQVVHHRELTLAAVLVRDVAGEPGDRDDLSGLHYGAAGHPDPARRPVGRADPVVEVRGLAGGEPFHRALGGWAVVGVDRLDEPPRPAFERVGVDPEHWFERVVDEQQFGPVGAEHPQHVGRHRRDGLQAPPGLHFEGNVAGAERVPVDPGLCGRKHERAEPHPVAVGGPVAVLERGVRPRAPGNDGLEGGPDAVDVVGVDQLERVSPDELVGVEPEEVARGGVDVPEPASFVDHRGLVLREIDESLRLRQARHIGHVYQRA